MTNIMKRALALALASILLLPILAGCGDQELVSIEKTQINKKGELIITYTDGSKENLGVVVGQDGKDGDDGADGDDGQDGTDGDDGTSGSIAAPVGTALRSVCSVICELPEGYSSGSGVIYQLDKKKGNAFIITNYHVVYSLDEDTPNKICDDITLYLYGCELEGREIEAEYVGGSQNYDIAVLYVRNSDVLKSSDAAAITVADSNELVPGQTAIAIGNPEGDGISVTSGIVSVVSERIIMEAADESGDVEHRVMRIDTPVNHGNSGGGLFNDQGQLIGIVNAKIIEDDVENMAYAIPSSVAIGAAQNIIDYCFESDCECVMRPMLGITITNVFATGVYDEEAGVMRIEETIQIHEVDRSSLVYGILEVDDILVSITLGDKTVRITRQHEIIDLMLWARVGDEIIITVLRDNREETVTVTLPKKCLTEY